MYTEVWRIQQDIFPVTVSFQSVEETIHKKVLSSCNGRHQVNVFYDCYDRAISSFQISKDSAFSEYIQSDHSVYVYELLMVYYVIKTLLTSDHRLEVMRKCLNVITQILSLPTTPVPQL